MSTKKNSFNDNSIELWYQQTVSKLYGFTYSLLQNREEVEDIIQETYFRCLRRDSKNFPAYPYLKKVARNLIYDRYRHWKKTSTQIQNLTQDQTVSTSEETWGTRALVQELMEQLPQQYRQVLELRIVEGYSRKETAKQMGRSEDAIRGLQYRALQALRDLLDTTKDNGG